MVKQELDYTTPLKGVPVVFQTLLKHDNCRGDYVSKKLTCYEVESHGNTFIYPMCIWKADSRLSRS